MSGPSITLKRARHKFGPAEAGATCRCARADLDRADLARLQLFSNADFNVIELLLASCPVVDLVRGDVLITDNEPNDALYLVLEGRLRVKGDSDEGNPISVIEAGDTVLRWDDQPHPSKAAISRAG